MHLQTQIAAETAASNNPGEWEASKPAQKSSRSKQFIQTLRQDFVYSEKRARDIIFQKVETAVRSSGEPLIISRLSREAASGGRTTAREVGFDFMNWDTAAKATINAMVSAGALLGVDQSPIPLTVATQATPVAAVVPEFRDVTEAYLIELLIRRVGDLTARDHTALAHALFRQFDPSVPMEDMEDRVACLVAKLMDRIGISHAGVYYAFGSQN